MPINFTPNVPGVSFNVIDGKGDSIEVYRDGKGDKLWLRRMTEDHSNVFAVYATTEGGKRVGTLGWSRQADAYCVESADRSLCFFADSLAEVIGEAGLYWIS